jgi:hypothetical protein
MAMSHLTNAQNITNNGFEDWKANSACECDIPTGWRADFDYFNEDQPVVKSSDAKEGSYSMLVLNPTFGDSGVFTMLPYAEFSQDALIGYVKSDMVGQDEAFVKVQYLKGKKVESESILYFSETYPDWTFFQLKLNKSATADSIKVAFYPSSLGKSSKLWVDEISISTYVGLEEMASDAPILYPNPTQGLLHISYPIEWQGDEVAIDILGLNGQLIGSFAGAIGTIDTRPFAPGLYAVVVRSAQGMAVHKVQFNQ